MNELERAAIISSFATAVIAIVKFVVGTLFGSVALIADAMHSFTDIIGSIAVFFGIRFSEIKTDKFPYGLYKLENLISLFLSLIIFYTSINIVFDVIDSIGKPVANAGSLTILAALFSLIVSLVLAKYKHRVGKKNNSPSMINESKHTKMDAITTMGVLIGVTASFLGYTFLDPIIGFLVALLVFKAGLEIFIDSSKVLLDASLDYKTLRKIESIIEKEKGVKVSSLMARSSGRYIFVEMKLQTNIKDLKKASQLKEKYEKEIKQKIPFIDKIIIETDYKKKNVLLYAIPIQKNSEISLLSEDFGTTNFFGFVKISLLEKKIISKKIVSNPFASKKSRKGILAARLLTKKKTDVLITKKEMHEGGAFYALQDNFIEMKTSKEKTFKKVIEEIIKGL
jgi:cation diffusion facilitator family transporter